MIMVVTSNFARHKALEKAGFTILPLYPRDGFSWEFTDTLRPPYDFDYFHNLNYIVTDSDYIELYTKYLASLSDEVWNKIITYLRSGNFAICSQARVGTFDARHVLADYLNTRFPGLNVYEYEY